MAVVTCHLCSSGCHVAVVSGQPLSAYCHVVADRWQILCKLLGAIFRMALAYLALNVDFEVVAWVSGSQTNYSNIYSYAPALHVSTSPERNTTWVSPGSLALPGSEVTFNVH